MLRESARRLLRALVSTGCGVAVMAAMAPVRAVATPVVEVDEQILALPLAPAGGVTNFASSVAVAINPLDGVLHAAFASPSGAIYVAQRSAGGWSLTRLDSLGRANAAKSLQLAFDSTGVGHLAYIDTNFNPPGPLGSGPQVLYRRWVSGAWQAAEPTTPNETIFTNVARALELGVSSDGSVVAIAASRGNAPAVVQIRSGGVWGARLPLTSAGQADVGVLASGNAFVGHATVAGVGRLLSLTSSGAESELLQLPGDHDLLRVRTSTTSAAGDLHAAWISTVSSTQVLNYWLHNPAAGWHIVPVPGAISAAVLDPTCNDFKWTIGPNSGLPWFLTSRGTGGRINGAQLALAYATGMTWEAMELNQAPGYNWRDGGATLGSMLMGSLVLDDQNRCHVVWQEYDTTGQGLRLRHVQLASTAPATLGIAPQRQTAGLQLMARSYAGGVRLTLQAAPELVGSSATIEVFDAGGRRVWDERVLLSANSEVYVEPGQLRAGIYFVRATAKGVGLTAKTVLLR